MGWFDTPIDFSDPQVMARIQMLGNLAGSFGDSAMPTALPTPMGAVLGRAARASSEGVVSGAKGAQAYRGNNLDITGKAISNDQSLIVENMLRRALGKPELTVQDLQSAGADAGTRSPLFGMPTISPQAQANVPTGTGTGTGSGNGTGSGAPASPASPVDSDQQSNSGSAQGDGIGNTLAMKMLGFQPTDYQRAKMAAAMLPPGPDRDEAMLAAAKAAGLAPTLDTRSGGMQSVLVPNKFNEDGTPVYKTIIKNPNIPEGYTLSDDGKSIVAMDNGPEAVSDIARRHALANAAGKMTADRAENYLETGGLGLGTAEGDLKAPNAAPSPGPAAITGGIPYAARVAQIEGSGNPNPPSNGASSAAGGDQFLNGTWLPLAKKYLPPQITQGRTDDQILALRADPQVSAFLTNQYATDNAKALQAGGVKTVGAPEVYLAHHFGPDGAAAILKAPVNTPLSQILPAAVLKANPTLANATVADVYSHANQQMQGVQLPTPQAQAQQRPQPGGVKSVIPPLSEAAPIPRGEIYLKDRIPQWTKAEDDMYDALPSGTIAEQRALAISDALKATQSGAWAQEKADIAAKLKAVGAPVPTSILGDPAAVQEALKNNFQSTLNQIRAFSSRPAAIEVQLASKNFANPDLQPEANLQIIGETVGTLRWERQMANDWGKAKEQGWVDPQDFQRAWAKANPIQGFIDQAQKEIGPLKGMAPVHAPSGKTMPAVGTVSKGYRFKGGDPAKQSSWEKVR